MKSSGFLLAVHFVLLSAVPCSVSALLGFVPQSNSRTVFLDHSLHRPSRHADICSPRSLQTRTTGKTSDGWQSQRKSAPSDSTSALSAIPATAAMAAAGASITKFYKAFPLVAGFLTASTKASLADSMAQYRDVDTTKFNAKRNLAMVLYSGFVLGISVEIMYNHIFPLMFKTAAVASTGQTSAVAMALKMTLFDGFINAPFLWLPPAYIAKAIVYRYPKSEGLQKYITDVKEHGLLKKYWSLWLPMSMINFLFVPDHFRVAFVAAVSFFWMIVLSMVANNNSGDQDLVQKDG